MTSNNKCMSVIVGAMSLKEIAIKISKSKDQESRSFSVHFQNKYIHTFVAIFFISKLALLALQYFLKPFAYYTVQ